MAVSMLATSSASGSTTCWRPASFSGRISSDVDWPDSPLTTSRRYATWPASAVVVAAAPGCRSNWCADRLMASRRAPLASMIAVAPERSSSWSAMTRPSAAASRSTADAPAAPSRTWRFAVSVCRPDSSACQSPALPPAAPPIVRLSVVSRCWLRVRRSNAPSSPASAARDWLGIAWESVASSDVSGPARPLRYTSAAAPISTAAPKMATVLNVDEVWLVLAIR